MAWGGGEVGVPRNIMRALCAVIRPDHFKFASYGPELGASEPSPVQRLSAFGRSVIRGFTVMPFSLD